MTINPASLPTVPPSPQDGLPLQVTVSELPIGTVQKVGDYKILGTLGSGGMGIVYKAFDQKLGRIVALKMLQVGREASHEEILRFRTEAEMLGRLQHPNIVQVFDFGIHEGAPFLVMEFVNGGSLEKRLQGTPQQPRRAAEWIEQIARAMHVAHENKVIHRDLKPANVLITIEGAPKITDFGLAKQMEASHGLTQTGAIMGTPSYMAPEQAEGKKDAGPPADIYSLGAMLYECLTGRPPFRGATLQETLEQVCNADPAPPSRLVPRLPRDLQTICLKCLEKAPGRRYKSAGELADDLKNWLDGLPVKARPTHSIERLIRIVARRPLRAALVAASLVALVLAVFLVLLYRDMQFKEQANQEKLELEQKANEQQLTYLKELAQQKEIADRAERAREEDRKALQNLRETMELIKGDRNNPAGLDSLEEKLDSQVRELKGKGKSPEKATVLAEVYFDLAGRWRALGESDRALSLLDKAEEMAQLAAERGDLDSRLKLTRVYQDRGFLRSEVSAAAAVKAAADCRKALELLDKMAGADADRPDVLRLRAETLHDLAVSLTNQLPENDAARCKNEAEAEKNYLEAQGLLRKLVGRKDATDADRRNLARTLGYLGDLYLDAGRYLESDEVYWESHLIREKLADDKPRDYERKYQLARSWGNFGDYQTRRRVLGSALHFYRKSEALRRDLTEKRPDNKEYVLELAGVLNRIAELELLTADPAGQPKRLAGTETHLRDAEVSLDKCEAQLRGLLKLLQEEGEQGREAKELTPRIHSVLGECLSLQARAALLRYDLSDNDKALLEKARTSARSAVDTYAEVLERRRSLTPSEQYMQVTAQLVSLGIWSETRASPEEKKGLPAFYAKHAETLKKILNGNFRRLAREEIWRDRALRSVREQDAFKAALRPDGPKSPGNGKGASAKDGKASLNAPASKGE